MAEHLPNNTGRQKTGRKFNLSLCKNFSKNPLNKNEKQDHIVLIGEWDTVYSRNFNRLFRKQIEELNGLKGVGWLHSFNYFRGIDGAVGRGADKTGSEDNVTKSKEKSKQTYRRPVGANQFDYLRRLGDQIADLSNSIVKTGSIRAIGIVGSDTYDMLLILQALRSRFPNIIFFTTDLDARMLHIAENSWARNLIVASAYGLSPDYTNFESLRFRSSYQTSLYLAAYNATQVCDKWIKMGHNDVKLFEVGNTAAIDYSQNSNILKQDFSGKVYIMLSLVLVLLLIYQTSNNTRKYIFISASVIYIVIFWLYLSDALESIEFNAILTGTSIWPALIVRMLAAVLAIYFIVISLANLKKNSIEIIKEYKLTDNNYNTFIDELRDCFNARSKTRQSVWNSVRACSNKTFDFVKGFYGIRFFTQNDINTHNLHNPSIWAHVFLTVWGWHYKNNAEIRIDELFYQYMHIAKTRYWLPRVYILAVLYFLLSAGFIQSFQNLPFTPFSDAISAQAHQLVLLAGLIPYTFLIFLVVDITRLNARFVELLTKCNVKWPNSVLEKYCDNYGVTEDVAAEKLKLDIIVLRSKTVDALIFLPFIVLSLMILSRSTYFDRWHMPLQLAFVILLGALIALSIDDIKQINSGPFAPITRHPIITAIAMPFGGIGGLYLIDYMASVGV
jgi:hypothetical protein